MEEQIEDVLKKLEKKLGYFFQDKSLLQRALTRESAIQERVPRAAPKSYQGLEFVGDAALKHCIARILFKKYGSEWTESQLHTETTRLIGNEGVLPVIAEKLGLSKFIICGKGEKTLTPKMKADMLEAVIGAISMDNPKQKGLFMVIERLWAPHMDEQKKKAVVKVNQVPMPLLPASSNNNNVVANTTLPPVAEKVSTNSSPQKMVTALISPPSPRTQRLFTGLNKNTPVEQFRVFVYEASDVNARNVGKKGDTALIKLFRKKELRPGIELPKIEALLERGALWTAQNNLGQTAESVAKAMKHGAIVTKLKAR